MGIEITPQEGAILGKRVAHCKVLGLSATSRAETAKLIDSPFWLWTRIGRRKHRFSRIRLVVPMYPTTLCHELSKNGYIGATWRIRLNHPSAVPMRPYVKLL